MPSTKWCGSTCSASTASTTLSGSAAANEAVAKALFMGGVTRRFPDLKFSFLEGGVGWACQLLSDLVAGRSAPDDFAACEINEAQRVRRTPERDPCIRHRPLRRHRHGIGDR